MARHSATITKSTCHSLNRHARPAMDFLDLLVSIDLLARGAEAFRFRVDSFEVSFGSAEPFLSEWGPTSERYLGHLRARMSELPGSCVHAWLGAQLVGQIELRGGREDPSEGYVNLYYLIPERRGSGLGEALDRYAVSWFSSQRLFRAALGVSPSNARAVQFYLKHGWSDHGVHPRHPAVRLMRKAWPSPAA